MFLYSSFLFLDQAATSTEQCIVKAVSNEPEKWTLFANLLKIRFYISIKAPSHPFGWWNQHWDVLLHQCPGWRRLCINRLPKIHSLILFQVWWSHRENREREWWSHSHKIKKVKGLNNGTMKALSKQSLLKLGFNLVKIEHTFTSISLNGVKILQNKELCLFCGSLFAFMRILSMTEQIL